MLALLVSALSFQPALQPLRASHACSSHSAPVMSAGASRRSVLAGLAAATAGVLPANAFLGIGDDPAAEAYKLKKDYRTDAANMLENMKTATGLTRGTPGMEDTVKLTRSQMIEFVAFYRRQPKVAGMPSFSTLYTAINTLSGHYASYGNKYPVPEKRRTRLNQQYKEVERALKRGK